MNDKKEKLKKYKNIINKNKYNKYWWQWGLNPGRFGD